MIVGQRRGHRLLGAGGGGRLCAGQNPAAHRGGGQRGTIVQYLLSDAGADGLWPRVKPCLNEGDALFFSHGFSIVYKDQTGIVAPPDIDVILVAPKGSGRTVRTNFLDGSGINSSFAVFQDFYRPGLGADPCHGHRHRLRVPLPHHL